MGITNITPRSRQRSQRRASAFTLIEIMIVVTIIGILLAMAIANFTRARESTYRKACMNNLRRIQYAKDSYMMDTNLPITEPASTFTDTVLYGSGKYLKDIPKCPGSGTYSPNDGGTLPTCNYQGGNVHTFGGDP